MLRLLILIVLLGSTAARVFYRKDYRYFSEFDAFYKFHSNGVISWLDAFIKCNSEGATLFYPALSGELAVVFNLTAASPYYNSKDIFVGIHDEFHIGEFITVDGSFTPIPILTNELELDSSRRCVLLDIETGKYKIEHCASEMADATPSLDPDPDNTGVSTEGSFVERHKGFICKRTIKPAACPTVDEGYKYNGVTRKCYKLNNQLKTWNEAYEQCYKEGAMLFVPGNSEEFEQVVHYMNENDNQNNAYYRRRTVYGDLESNYYFIGIQKLGGVNGEYFTSKGVPMLAGGVYQKWYNQAYEQMYVDGKDCVAIGRIDGNGYYYKPESCFYRNHFICAMKANGV